jgi:hypothetical protein
MKPYWAKESTYKFFDEFLTSCIVHDDTLLLKESKHIMDTTMIGECLKTIDIVKKSTPTKYFENFINQKENDKIILGHAVWFWSFVDHDTHNKIEGLISENDLNETYLQQTGIGGCGQFYKSHKGDEIIGILNNWVGFKNLIKETNCKDLDEVKQIIINNINSENIKTTIPMKNILLHLCNP